MAYYKGSKAESSVDISQFFSRKNEEEGVWYEPKVKGIGVGFEFKIYGPNSNAVSIADNIFQKKREEAELIMDDKEKAEKMDQIIAERFAAYITDIRSKDGRPLLVEGHEATEKDFYDIIYNSPVIALDISRFASRQDNFLGTMKSE